MWVTCQVRANLPQSQRSLPSMPVIWLSAPNLPHWTHSEIMDRALWISFTVDAMLNFASKRCWRETKGGRGLFLILAFAFSSCCRAISSVGVWGHLGVLRSSLAHWECAEPLGNLQSQPKPSDQFVPYRHNALGTCTTYGSPIPRGLFPGLSQHGHCTLWASCSVQHPDSCMPTYQLWHICDTDVCFLLVKRLGTLCGPGKPGSFRNICTTALGKEPPIQGVLILPWVLSVSLRVPVSYPHTLYSPTTD